MDSLALYYSEFKATLFSVMRTSDKNHKKKPVFVTGTYMMPTAPILRHLDACVINPAREVISMPNRAI